MTPSRIDTHFHVLPEFYLDAVGAAGITRSKAKPYPDWSVELSLRLMDAYGIATAITSFSTPHVHFGDDLKARHLARQCNEYAIGLVQQRPDRFGSFAVLPLPDVEAACREAAFALDELAADGVTVLASYGETFFGDSIFDPLLAELDERAAVVFVHPTQHPEAKKLALDLPLFVAEYPINTTRAALNLMTKKVIKRFPNIRFVLAHAGGVLPFLAWRLAIPRVPAVWEDDVHGYLRHFWYDIALAAGKQSLGSLKEVADLSKILFGTDWPYTSDKTVEWTIRDYAEPRLFTDKQRQDIDRENSLTLFPRLRKFF
jgi:predicted TIM-barrel fold metal-dependent hydrolase